MMYKEPIKIMKQIATKDAVGKPKKVMELVHSCKANVNGVGGREYYLAAQQQAENDVTFEVRYCSALADIIPQDTFVEFRGKMYDISYIDNFQFQDKTLKLRGTLKV